MESYEKIRKMTNFSAQEIRLGGKKRREERE